MKLRKQILLEEYSILKFIHLFTAIILLTFTSTNEVLAKGSDIKEYGIVILPEEKCQKEAERLNINIAKILRPLKNVKNYWHVTLYHGAYEKNDLHEIYAKLKGLQLKPLTLNFTKIYSTSDRWIDLGTEKTEYLQKLHISVVQLASPYHKRPLARCKDIYKNVSSNQRQQVDHYGVSGILEMYNPHMTLFYQYPPKTELQQAAIKIENDFKKNMICKASKIVIGELGYNGNIKKIVYSVNMPD